MTTSGRSKSGDLYICISRHPFFSFHLPMASAEILICFQVTARFFRHFSMICVQPPSEMALRTIFGAILGGFLQLFAQECKSFLKPIVDSSIEIYLRITQELLPTPTKSHYTFNLRDVSKVFQVSPYRG